MVTMRKIFPLFCFLLLGCGLSLNGGESCEESYNLKTTMHKPLNFDFVWREDSLVSAYVYLKSEESVPRSDCPNCSPDCDCCFCKITTGRYALNFKESDLDSLNAEEKLYRGFKMDSTVVKLFHSVDSSQHLEFFLKDSANVVKSYDLDMAPLLSYINNPKHYEIRGDSIDIFLPEGDFYVWYRGSCYNGVDNFSDLSHYLSSLVFYDGTCIRYKTSQKPETITLEIAAMHGLFYEVRFGFGEANDMETDSFSFRWNYSDAL